MPAHQSFLLKKVAVKESLNEVYSYVYTTADDQIKNSKNKILNLLAEGKYDVGGKYWVCKEERDYEPENKNSAIHLDIIRQLLIDGKRVFAELELLKKDNDLIEKDKDDNINIIDTYYLSPWLNQNPVQNSNLTLEKLKKDYTQDLLQIPQAVVTDIMRKVGINVISPFGQRCNLYFQELDNHYYLDVEISDIPLRRGNEAELVGILPGTIKVKYQWNDSGFEFKEMNFSNAVLASLLDDDQPLSWEALQETLQKKIPVMLKDKNQLDLGIFQLDRLAEALKDEDFRKGPINNLILIKGLIKDLLDKIQKLRKRDSSSIPLLTDVVLQTYRYLEIKVKGVNERDVNEHIVEEYTKLADHIAKACSWGKIIAGSMLALVAISVVALGCASGFGIIALPFMAWGLTVVLSSAASASLALASVGASIGLFASAKKDGSFLMRGLKHDMDQIIAKEKETVKLIH